MPEPATWIVVVVVVVAAAVVFVESLWELQQKLTTLCARIVGKSQPATTAVSGPTALASNSGQSSLLLGGGGDVVGVRFRFRCRRFGMM